MAVVTRHSPYASSVLWLGDGSCLKAAIWLSLYVSISTDVEVLRTFQDLIVRPL